MRAAPIAMLHHVEDRRDWSSLQPYCISKNTFTRLIQEIEKTGKKGVSFEQALANPSGKNVILTFDDGAQHLWDFAIPTLIDHQMTASFFIPTHHIGKTNSWDVQEGRAEVNLMDKTAIQELKKVGMEVGGHSHDHVRLASQDEGAILEQLRQSKAILDDLMDQDTQTMAWPYGSVPNTAKTLLEETGWKQGLSIFSRTESPWSKRRFIVHDGDSAQSIRIKCGPYYRAYRGIMDRRGSQEPTQH